MVDDTTRRVLIVDDDANLVFAVTEALNDAGYETMAARDGHAAIQSISRLAPDVILLDLNMPHVGGFAVIEWLKQHSIQIPTILSTTDDEWTASALGVFSKLAKPFTLDQLLDAVRLALR
jgi:DNA-binding response OmpR family regulator